MANSIDLSAIILGAAIGYGLRKEIRSTGYVCRNALLGAVAAAATTAQQTAQSAEEKAAAEMLQRVDQQIAGQGQGQPGQKNG